jgi:hypothetical protein
MKVVPNYHPPSDYRRPTKTQEKVYVPVNDYPEINFSTILLTLSLLTLFLAPVSCRADAYGFLRTICRATNSAIVNPRKSLS